MYPFLAVLALCWTTTAAAQQRLFQPTDLFRYERVGAIAWSPDRSRAAVEIHRPGRWVSSAVPTAEMAVVDVGTATMRVVARPSAGVVGYYRPAWATDGRSLVFLSVDTNGLIRPWVWRVGEPRATAMRGLVLHEALADPPFAQWSDPDHLVMKVRDDATDPRGPLYALITQGRGTVDRWHTARANRVPAVSVLETPNLSPTTNAEPNIRLISVNVRTLASKTLASGPVHAPSLSPDGRILTFRREDPAFRSAPAASFFGSDAQGDSAYDRVNWGHTTHRLDSRTGEPVAATATRGSSTPAPATGQPRLERVNTSAEGTRLVLSRPGLADSTIWRGNSWIAGIRGGRSEAVTYRTVDGRQLTGWVLYPPDRRAGERMPVIAMVYPGAVFDDKEPSDFSLFSPSFNHPQLFAALGYAVVLPSIPLPEKQLSAPALDTLKDSVLPLLDTLIDRGVADTGRIAVMGQSGGGWATLGLIATTNRFRSAIASASYSNLTSFYGTLYGQYRHGDAGDPQRAQVLRMLQFERGFFGIGGPPWQVPELYRSNSPIHRVQEINTPLLLVHGELDFVPIQQAEEMFTALYRQDKPVRLLRYAGEQHTIDNRANVLDLWSRTQAWLTQTLGP